MITYLRWFRDKGRGQEAADATGAVQEMDGIWPIAKLPADSTNQEELWRMLCSEYGVNATYYQHVNVALSTVTVGSEPC